MATKGAPTVTVLLAGDSYRLRYEQPDMTNVETALKGAAFGMASRTFLQLMDGPYSVLEIQVLLLMGINGARRLEKAGDALTMEDMNTLLTRHWDYIGRRSEGDLKQFQALQADLINAISQSVRGAMGFWMKPKNPLPTPSEPDKEST